MPKPVFSSTRLDFHPWRDVDPENLLRINADTEVMEHFPRTLSAKETLAFIDRNNALFDAKGYCYFAAVERASNEVIGFVGAFDQNYESPYTPCTDIGWRIDRAYWGQGYATEGAEALLNFLKENSTLNVVRSMAPVSNKASIAVMKKLGMQYLGNFVHPALVDIPRICECACCEFRLK